MVAAGEKKGCSRESTYRMSVVVAVVVVVVVVGREIREISAPPLRQRLETEKVNGTDVPAHAHTRIVIMSG